MVDKYEYDYKLFQRCVLDDVDAKEELFRVYTPYILRRVRAQVPEAVVNDIVSEICVRLLVSMSRNKYKGLASLQTYIHKIIVFAIADFWRKEYRRREISFEDLDEDIADELSTEFSDNLLDSGLIDHLLSKGATNNQRAFVRLMLSGLSYGEASELADITYEAGRSRYRRAVTCIKEYVAKNNILEV